MKSEKIEALIRAFKKNSDITLIFWENIAYSSFFKDLDNIWLILEPIYEKKKDCYKNSLLQVKIIDSKIWNTRMQLKKYMEMVEDFLTSKLKNFGWEFETLAVVPTWDEVILKNEKSRLVFVKRFNFYY